MKGVDELNNCGTSSFLTSRDRKGALSVDVDSLSRLCRGIRNVDADENDVTYRRILPRFLDFFKARKVRATFFIVGEDVRTDEHRSMLRRIVDEGHELGNHTFSHILDFSSLPRKEKEQEIAQCEEVIGDATGTRPLGFRAPGFDINSETMRILEERQYRYDSSIFPTAAGPLYFLILFALSGKPSRLKPMRNFMNSFAPLRPYHPGCKRVYCRGDSRVLEVPVNAVPGFRVPFYGSWSLATGSRRLFDYSFKKLLRSAIPLHYVLHAADLYDRDRDVVDERIRRLKYHSVTRGFGEKIEFYRYIFDRLLGAAELVPLREFVADGTDGC
jgi:peptidoglycan-N-acetylglucosamine deacetylase